MCEVSWSPRPYGTRRPKRWICLCRGSETQIRLHQNDRWKWKSRWWAWCPGAGKRPHSALNFSQATRRCKCHRQSGVNLSCNCLCRPAGVPPTVLRSSTRTTFVSHLQSPRARYTRVATSKKLPRGTPGQVMATSRGGDAMAPKRKLNHYVLCARGKYNGTLSAMWCASVYMSKQRLEHHKICVFTT